MFKINLSTPANSRDSVYIWRGLVIILLLLFFHRLIAGINDLSLTYDEPIYIGVGYSDWLTKDMAWHEHTGHPPLLNVFTSWPLLLTTKLLDPRSFSQFGGSDFLGFARDLIPYLGSVERTTYVTRVPVVWLSILFAALVYRWSTKLWRSLSAGILTLLFFTVDPTIVAHGRLNTTDMGLAFFGFLTAYTLSQYLKNPTMGNSIAVGATSGMALSSKASGAYFLGIAGLLLIIWSIIVWRKKQHWIQRLFFHGASWIFIALLILWASYFFELKPIGVNEIPIPAASHWKGLSFINSYMQSGQTSFFWGKLYTDNHPLLYFPVALLVKTPVPVLMMFIVAFVTLVVNIINKKSHGNYSAIFVLMCVPIGYMAFAMLLALQIGHRHLLPIYPFLFVLIGQVSLINLRHLSAGLRNFIYCCGFGLLVWTLHSSFRVFPFELSYYNELVGSPENGHQIFADSSSDWGQAILETKTYTTKHSENDYKLAAFSSLDPAIFDFTYTPLPPTANAPVTMTRPFNPEPGTYLISAVPLNGLWLVDQDTYSWFRYREPDEVIANAIRVYHVTNPSSEPTWVALCTDFISPPVLNQSQMTAGFGIKTLRVVLFDCERSWVYPEESGWYVIPYQDNESSWLQKRLDHTALTYSQQDHWSHNALSIHHLENAEEVNSHYNITVKNSGPLTYLGYELSSSEIKSGEVLEVTTFWRVGNLPSRPLSLMAHMIAPDGRVIQVADGLGYPIEYWLENDMILQRHIFHTETSLAPGVYRFIVGGYWLDNMERWTFPGVENNAIQAGVIQVTQ